MRPLLVGILAVASICAATPAHADLSPPKSPDAKAHNDQGNRYYKVQEFDKAIEEYQKGAEIEDAPIFLYNLGQCHRQLGNYDKAIWFYKRFLSSGNVDEQVAMYVRDFIKVMQAKKEQELKDKPPVEPEPRGEGSSRELGEQRPDDGEMEIVGSAPPWHTDTIAWTLTGAGIIGSGVGVGFLVNASSLESDADMEPDATRRDDLRATADGRRTIGTIVTVTGAAVLVAGVVKLVLTPEPRKTREAAVWIVPSPSGLGVAGRF